MTWSAPRARTRSSLRGAAHAGDLGAERLGDLHGERAHASRRADDQHLLPGCTRPLSRTAWSAATAEMGTAAACSNDRFAGLRASCPGSDDVRTRRRSRRSAVDLVARLELGDVLADGLDRSREAPPGLRRLGRAEPEADARRIEVRQAGHQMPRAQVHAGRRHPHEDLVVADRGPGDLGESEHGLGRGAVRGPGRSRASSPHRRSSSTRCHVGELGAAARGRRGAPRRWGRCGAWRR